MNVLLLILDGDELTYACIPRKVLKSCGYHYKDWDGCILNTPNENKYKQPIQDEIMDVFSKLGLEEGPRKNQTLRRYVYAKPPFRRIEFVIKIGWVE